MPARLLSTFIVVTALSLAGAQAESKKGPNGGAIVISDGHPIELVHNDTQITFYVMDDDGKTPAPSKGMKARAVVQDKGKTTTIPLSPEPPNRLVGKLQAPLNSKARVVISVSFDAGSHKHALQGRFTVE